MPKGQLGVMRDFLAQTISTQVTLTTKEERQIRDRIEEQLIEAQVEDADEIANTLVEVRVVENIDKYVPILLSKHCKQVMAVIYKLGQLKVNLGNIDMASDKTTRIVKALKNYAYVQSTDRLVPTDLSESVEAILTMMHNQTKYGIEVVRNYADVPQVPIFPDELGQVWTNIITNGIQAMGGAGQLTIDVSIDTETHVRVAISDNGPGIPPEIKSRIFEPFFTTKPQGEGTGLGLDISKKIVEKHQGEISVTSEPGCTTFIVRLPIHPKGAEQLLEGIPVVE
jgi:signal transduction histidine kinase